MKGYIGITAHHWWNYIKDKNIPEVNFWNKKKTFKVLEAGDYFFFLKKNEPGENGERAVVGYAEYVRFEYLEPETAWEKYTNGNGHPNKEKFIDSMGSTLSADNLENIGCIILKDYKSFDTPVYLSDLKIDFATSIVSGKSITEEECKNILAASADKKISNINIPLEPFAVKELNGLVKVVCGKCKCEFEKASRCPECGQLVKFEE